MFLGGRCGRLSHGSGYDIGGQARFREAASVLECPGKLELAATTGYDPRIRAVHSVPKNELALSCDEPIRVTNLEST